MANLSYSGFINEGDEKAKFEYELSSEEYADLASSGVTI
jgi:hypothetical protein